MTRDVVVTCDSLFERISAYLDEELSADVCHAIETHAASCPACREVIDDFRRTTGLCRRAAAAPLPPAVRKLARSRVNDLLTRPPGRR